MSCGIHGLDPELLWLWCRPAATAPIPPLAWEPPYATGMALKRQKDKKKKKKSASWRRELQCVGGKEGQPAMKTALAKAQRQEILA